MVQCFETVLSPRATSTAELLVATLVSFKASSWTECPSRFPRSTVPKATDTRKVRSFVPSLPRAFGLDDVGAERDNSAAVFSIQPYTPQLSTTTRSGPNGTCGVYFYSILQEVFRLVLAHSAFAVHSKLQVAPMRHRRSGGFATAHKMIGSLQQS